MNSIAFDYTEIPIESCLELGTRLIKERKKVHFHVLSPGCMFNPKPHLFGFVIEDNSNNVTYLSFSRSFPDVDKDLTKMLHGDSVVDESHSRLEEPGFVESSNVLSKIVTLSNRGKSWHHHIHFPECILNPQKGKWSISVEEGEHSSEITVETFDKEPLDIIREIEILYFKDMTKESFFSPQGDIHGRQA